MTGTPTLYPGSYDPTVTVTDGVNSTITANLSLTIASNGGPIGGQSYLETTLGYMPFDKYNNTVLASSNPGLTKACPLGSTVRGCYVTVLQNMKAQGVSGIRVLITFCDVFHFSNPITNCGNLFNSGSPPTWNPSADPGLTWLNNVNSFFDDVHAAGISKVTLDFFHNDGSAGTFPTTAGIAKSSTSSPSGLYCGDTPDTVYFWVTEPFGMKMQPDGSLYPIGQENDGYNCAPINPYFVGWNNQFGVIDAMLGAAESNQVTVEELEFETELNLVAFSSHLRLIYDNASPELAPGTKMNIVSNLRTLMSKYGFDPLRVAWSIPWSAVTSDTTNCLDAYGDYARGQPLDALAAAIYGYQGGYIGAPLGATPTNFLYCYGTLDPNSMQQSPFSEAPPDIVDAHIYSGISEGGDVVGNAEIDFGDLANFLSLQNLQPAPLVIIGETWQGTPSHAYNYGAPCALVSDSAPADNITGFHYSGFPTVIPIVFRPWMELWNDTGACYAYNGGGHNSYQNLNYSGTGPYVPALQ